MLCFHLTCPSCGRKMRACARQTSRYRVTEKLGSGNMPEESMRLVGRNFRWEPFCNTVARALRAFVRGQIVREIAFPACTK